jgi:hypothetical protein
VTTLALVLLLATPTQAGEGDFTFPIERHGAMTATLSLQLPERGPAPGLARVQLTLRVTGPTGCEVDGPRLEDALAGWRVQWAISSWASQDDQALWEQTLNLVQVKPGVVPLPGVVLRLRAGPGEKWKDVLWPDLLQEARAVAPPETQPPLPPSPWPERLRLGGIVLGVLLGLGLLLRGLQRWRSGRMRPLPAHQRALVRLEQIPDEALAAVAYLDRVLRDYLAERFAVEALRMTTKELVVALQERAELPVEQWAELTDLLAWCDRGKFANVEVDGVREAGYRARQFLTATALVSEARTNREERKAGEKQGDAKEG